MTAAFPLNAVEIDEPAFDDGSATVGDRVLAPVPPAVDREDARAAVAALLGRLPLRSRLVLVARFGLAGQEPADLAEIGEALGVSRERVRQLEGEALARLREVAVQSPARVEAEAKWARERLATMRQRGDRYHDMLGREANPDRREALRRAWGARPRAGVGR